MFNSFSFPLFKHSAFAYGLSLFSLADIKSKIELLFDFMVVVIIIFFFPLIVFIFYFLLKFGFIYLFLLRIDSSVFFTAFEVLYLRCTGGYTYAI